MKVYKMNNPAAELRGIREAIAVDYADFTKKKSVRVCEICGKNIYPAAEIRGILLIKNHKNLID